MRRGFGLITAIVIMITVATLMTLMIGLSSTSVKVTLDLYLKEQAELLSRSATEYALLAISGHENNASCIENINISYPKTSPTHEANITIWYIGNGIPITCSNILVNNIETNESNLTVIIDTVVSVNLNNTGITEPIRVHRRTIQKP
ncbi:MAG TPA: type II secretion system protein [Campylobacterales bacterium]|nr:type II secretion system protein [Campylobacterales bacterium]